MNHLSPGSHYACDQIALRLRGKANAVYKPDILLHAQRLAVAMEAGFKSWEEYRDVKDFEMDLFMLRLLKGELK